MPGLHAEAPQAAQEALQAAMRGEWQQPLTAMVWAVAQLFGALVVVTHFARGKAQMRAWTRAARFFSKRAAGRAVAKGG